MVDKTIELRICKSSSKLRSSQQVPRPLIPLFCNSLYSLFSQCFSVFYSSVFFASKPLTFLKSLPDLFALGCLSALGSSLIYISRNSKSMELKSQIMQHKVLGTILRMDSFHIIADDVTGFWGSHWFSKDVDFIPLGWRSLIVEGVISV